MYPKQLKDEYAGFKVLALHAHNGGLIHTSDKKVVAPQDLKGLRLRSPSIAVNKMLGFFGATALGMPPLQIAVNLRGGLIDGALFSWEGAHSFKIDEVTRYHLDARAFTEPYFFMMNQKKYQALPADVRKAIDEISGDTLVAKFGAWWNRWDQPGIEVARKRGGVVTVLNAAARTRWANAVAPTTDKLLGEMQKVGVTNARAVHAEMKRLNKELSK
jgi:TRAP-type transport system periplasmic protein